jgi:hypothetical protein
MHLRNCTRLLALLVLAPVLGAHGGEEPHYKRPPFVVPGLSDSVEEFSLSSDQHLDAVAIHLGGSSGRIVAILNDGRGLEDNWTPAEIISDNTNVTRVLNDDACQVFEDQAFVSWLDDRDGAGLTRVHFNRYDPPSDSWLPAAVELDDSTYPHASDVRRWRMVVKRGTSGGVHVIVLAALRSAGQDHVFVSISPDGGSNFNPPVRVHASASSPGTVGAVACDLRFGELHLAWTDDRAGTMDVHYRLALLDFFGNPLFLEAERAISTGPGTNAVGRLVLQANAEFGWSGSDQKYVGVAYLQNDGDGTTNLHVLTSQDNGTSFGDALIAETATPGTAVAAFDFEIPGDTFVVTWEDDSDGTPQTYRSQSDDGAAFLPATRISGFEEPKNMGFAPRISPSFGNPDGACIVFLEQNPFGGIEINSSFGDQAFGAEWHDEEYPQVSNAAGKGAGAVEAPDVSYNQLYCNYVVGWREESAPGSGFFNLVLGGYRPPWVRLEGWRADSASMHFEVLHLPFQDTGGYVVVSLAPPTSGPGTVLYDGRKTGFVPDGLTNTWLTNRWAYSVFLNDSANEGGTTRAFVFPPMASGPDLTFQAVSWGPFGELHTLTEPQVQAFEGPLVKPRRTATPPPSPATISAP